MIYLIGGAARSGKTWIARRLLEEGGIPCFCLDYFVSALDQGAPELGIEAESPNMIRARKLWPRLVPMLRNIVEVEPQYTVEGDTLWPAGVKALFQEYPGQVRACFIGYAGSTPARKLAEIRGFGGGVNNWLLEHPDEYILDLAREMIGYSRFVQEECAALDIPYFDVSEDFPQVLERAYQSLTYN
jgi:hypothetical protein